MRKAEDQARDMFETFLNTQDGLEKVEYYFNQIGLNLIYEEYENLNSTDKAILFTRIVGLKLVENIKRLKEYH